MTSSFLRFIFVFIVSTHSISIFADELHPFNAECRRLNGLSVEDTIRAAVEHSGLTSPSPSSLIARARWSAWLPVASVAYSHSLGENFDSDSASSSTSFIQDNLYLRQRITVRFSWDLSELIFNPHETRAISSARLLTQSRTELVETVVKLYYERCTLESNQKPNRRDKNDINDNDIKTQKLRLSEINAILSFLTGRLSGKR